MRKADCEWFGAWQSHLLRSSDDVERLRSELAIKPFYDPVLRNNKLKYAEFLRELSSRGLLRWRRVRRSAGGRVVPSDASGNMGAFFVVKKNGTLRLIFDTRLVNTYFHAPTHTKLPSAAAFSNVECPQDGYCMAHADIENAFYGLQVPPSLSEFFTLEPIGAEHVGCPALMDGTLSFKGEMLVPCLAVLPMGWSWSLALCQSVLEAAVEDAGFSRDQFIVDREPGRVVSPDRPAVAAYVDNFAVIASSPEVAIEGVQKISAILVSKGLRVHPPEGCSLDFTPSSLDFLGMTFRQKHGLLQVKSDRAWRLRFAIDEIIRRKQVSGQLLESVLGHSTWLALIRRESLSIFSAIYPFIKSNYETIVPLWDSVIWELRTFRNILPLLQIDLGASWHETVTASDSSPAGYGVCVRDLHKDAVRDLGKVTERWRFHCEDRISARASALNNIEVPVEPLLLEPPPDQHPLRVHFRGPRHCTAIVDKNSAHTPCVDGPAIDTSNSIFDIGASAVQFDEVPATLMESSKWSVVCSRKWKDKENILKTEARALVWSLRHQLRNSACHGKKLVAFVDNLPLALACCKGRATSQLLTPCLRQICALLLCSGSRMFVRWVPSELNPADAPSRGFGRWLSPKDTVSPSICPTTCCQLPRHGAEASQETWPSSGFETTEQHLCPGPRDRRRESSSRCARDPPAERRRPLRDSARPDGDLHSIGDRFNRPCPIGSVSSSHVPLRGMVHRRGHGLDIIGADRRGGRGVPQLPVQRRRASSPGHLVPGGLEVLLPAVRPRRAAAPASVLQGAARVEQEKATAPKGAVAPAGGDGYHRLAPLRLERCGGVGRLLIVPLLPATGRVREPQGAQPGLRPGRSKRADAVGSPHAHAGRPEAIENRLVRRGRNHRCRSLDQPLVGNRGAEPLAAAASQHAARPAQDGLPGRLPEAAPGPLASVPLSAAARRRFRRHAAGETSDSRHQSTGSLAKRQQPQTLLEANPSAARASAREPRRQSTGVICRHPFSNSFSHSEVHSISPCRQSHKPSSTQKLRCAYNNRKFICSKVLPNRTVSQEILALRRAFKEELRKSRKRTLVLELFSGEGGLSDKIRKHGYAVLSFDFNCGSHFDLCKSHILSLVIGWICSGCVLFVWLGTPCSSWSLARRGPAGSSWGPIRDKEHILGLPNLSDSDQCKIDNGNKTANASKIIIRCCVNNGIPCALENPANSRLFHSPYIMPLSLLTCCDSTTIDFCQYGTRWRKRTRIMSWNFPEAKNINKRCSSKLGICSRTGKPHMILSGSDPVSHLLWTVIAQPYPCKLCSEFAKAIDCRITCRLHDRLRRLIMQ